MEAIFLLLVFMLATMAGIFLASRSYLILYSLAAVVSLVGINIHFGVTLYLSRLVIIFLVISLAVQLMLGRRIKVPVQFLTGFVKLFSLILIFQLISVLLSPRFWDGMRQIWIYISVMIIFLSVLLTATNVEAIIKAIKIYILAGLAQGLYGIYMVIGGPHRWPTYQTLMAGIPTANDQTVNGYVYSGAYSSFRAGGFFPADMSHYAGYMAGVLILAMALISYDRKKLFPYFVLLFGGAGLLLSLSRSGIVAFVVFGIPTLFFLLSRIRPRQSISDSQSPIVPFFLGFLILAIASPIVKYSLNDDLPNVTGILSSRFGDMINPGSNDKESMGEHFETRLAGLKAFSTSPFLGVGLGVNASPWQPDDGGRGWAGSHSHHLDILGQTGIVGAGLQFIFMFWVGRYMWRGLFVSNEKSLARHTLAGLLAAYVAIIMGNFLYHYFTLDYVWFLMGAGVALSRLLIRENEKFVHP